MVWNLERKKSKNNLPDRTYSSTQHRAEYLCAACAEKDKNIFWESLSRAALLVSRDVLPTLLQSRERDSHSERARVTHGWICWRPYTICVLHIFRIFYLQHVNTVIYLGQLTKIAQRHSARIFKFDAHLPQNSPASTLASIATILLYETLFKRSKYHPE